MYDKLMEHIVFYSGGAASWTLAKRVKAKYPNDNIKLLFTDTKMEDVDLYRFLIEGTSVLDLELIQIADGRTPWEVFKDEKYLGNSRVDPCSRILKRELALNWVKKNCPDHNSTKLWIGMNWDEEHRLRRCQKYWEPYQVDSLLLEKPLLFKEDMLQLIINEGIEPPNLYKLGFSHNNCGGFCIKGGQASFRHLLKMLPEVYIKAEREEENMRQFLQKDVSILQDRRKNAVTKILTLKMLRQRKENNIDKFDWGGCGCFIPDEEFIPIVPKQTGLTENRVKKVLKDLQNKDFKVSGSKSIFDNYWGKKFKVSSSAIQDIRLKRTWKNVQI